MCKSVQPPVKYPPNPPCARKNQVDREFLNADNNTKFEKIVSPDGKEVTFRKIESVRPNVLETANKLFDENADLMKRLENL